MIFTEIEVADFKGQIRRDVLQLSVLLDFVLVVFGSHLQVVDVRGIQDHLGQTNGITDAGKTLIYRDVDDVGDLLDLLNLIPLEQFGADKSVFVRDREDRAVQMIEIGFGLADLDDTHVEGSFHPVIGLPFGPNPVSPHIQVVVEAFEFRFPFELRLRDVNLITHGPEEGDSDLRLAATGLRHEIGDNDRVPARQVLEHDT